MKGGQQGEGEAESAGAAVVADTRRLDLTLLPHSTVLLHMCQYLDVASLVALR